MTKRNTDDKEKLKNKGVSASDIRNKGVRVSRSTEKRYYDTDEVTCTCTEDLERIKHEVQTVIELMGPATPAFSYSSNMADSEDTSKATNEQSTPAPHVENKTPTVSFCESAPCGCKCNRHEGCACDCTDADVTTQDFSLHMTSTSIAATRNTTYTENQAVTESTPQMICPPPFLSANANVQFNSECMCPQVMTYVQRGVGERPPPNLPPPPPQPFQSYEYNERQAGKSNNKGRNKKKSPKKSCGVIGNMIRSLRNNQKDTAKFQYYTMNVKQSKDNHKPERLVFELVPRTPGSSCKPSKRCSVYHEAKSCNLEDIKEQKNMCNAMITERRTANKRDDNHREATKDIASPGRLLNEKFTCSADNNNEPTRMDVYYFDHGNSSYLRTTDNPPIITTEILAERTEAYTTKFWAEVFGTLHVGISFATSFILQLIRFILYSLIRPLTVGLLQLLSDYFFKPFLTTIFNACIQPLMAFVYNVATSLRDLLDPLAEGLGFFLREIAHVIRAFRLFEQRKSCRSVDGDNYCGCSCVKRNQCEDRPV